MSFSSVNFIVNRNSIIFLFLGLLTSMLFVLDLLSGDSALSVGQVWNAFMGNETNMTTRNIVLSIRLVRVIVAVLIGVALSISGFPEPAGRSLLVGSKFRIGIRRCFLYSGSSPAGTGTFRFLAVGWYCRGWMGRGRHSPVTDCHHQPLREKYPWSVDHGSDDRLHRGSHHTDFTVLEFCRAIENVLPLVDGFPRARHDHETIYHDSRDLRGCYSLDLLYQSIKSSSTRRELCPNDGTKYTACPNTYFRIDNVVNRNRDSILRPGRLSRTCRASRSPYVV